MKKIKKFFLTLSGMATLLFFKAGTVFGMDSVALYGVPSPKYNEVPELYGVPTPVQPSQPATEIGDIFAKIALFVLLPLCIIALITVGIVALVKVNKKKKQANANMNQNINNNNRNV